MQKPKVGEVMLFRDESGEPHRGFKTRLDQFLVKFQEQASNSRAIDSKYVICVLGVESHPLTHDVKVYDRSLRSKP
jgi:hypothetical protein